MLAAGPDLIAAKRHLARISCRTGSCDEYMHDRGRRDRRARSNLRSVAPATQCSSTRQPEAESLQTGPCTARPRAIVSRLSAKAGTRAHNIGPAIISAGILRLRY